MKKQTVPRKKLLRWKRNMEPWRIPQKMRTPTQEERQMSQKVWNWQLYVDNEIGEAKTFTWRVIHKSSPTKSEKLTSSVYRRFSTRYLYLNSNIFNGLESPGMANWFHLLMDFNVQWASALWEEHSWPFLHCSMSNLWSYEFIKQYSFKRNWHSS